MEYEDGTPATTSQMAKDVVEFLNWAAEPEMDERKKMGVATILVTSVLFALSVWVKRYVIYFRNYEGLADSPFQVQVVTYQDTENRVQPSSGGKLSGTRTWVIVVIIFGFSLCQGPIDAKTVRWVGVYICITGHSFSLHQLLR